MRKGKNRSKKSNAAEARELCIKVVAVIIWEYTEIAHNLGYDRKEISAFAEAAARLGQIARDEEHLTELLAAFDYEMIEQRIPLKKRGTNLLKLALSGPPPEVG